LHIWATPVKSATSNEGASVFNNDGSRFVVADGKGRFVIERVASGEYELRLNAMVRVSQNAWSGAPGMREVRQRIIVGGGSETLVKLTLVQERR
jgi:hypothetical protein